ncbi:DNA-binding transcriptional LysR family regulator [Rhizobium herbae]|uniref:DNA-binding transcriptional LysR family regulator n=1 Tax=Rhizobium herbae TaxID=508661 RepID=A0ABS4ENV4_9HYPH|nr:DNA-binding transcriptional LysR family regulator [Rhizobium herbae]
MKRGRLPLTALRSFEAAGRLESFTLAAEELFVSQAAISRQVRELEALLGTALFTRHHRKVRLSAEGARLLETLAEAFDSVDARLEEIRSAKVNALLTVNAEPAFAACWLVPHLADFRALHPKIDVSVESEARLVEFRGNAAELAIRHSAQASSWPRAQARHLCDVAMVPVVSPAVLTHPPLETPQDLLSYTLLHEENRDVWTRWFSAAGLTPGAGRSSPIARWRYRPPCAATALPSSMPCWPGTISTAGASSSHSICRFPTAPTFWWRASSIICRRKPQPSSNGSAAVLPDRRSDGRNQSPAMPSNSASSACRN